MLEKSIQDSLNVDGDRGLSDTWTGFTRFTKFKEKPPDGYTWSGRRLTGNQTTSCPDKLWPAMWKRMSDASKREVGHRETIYFIDPEEEEFKLTMKNASRTMEIPMPATMPCKTSLCRSRRESAALFEDTRQNTLVLLKLTNL